MNDAAQGEDPDRLILDAVDRFLDRHVRPVAMKLEHDDTYPSEIVERMRFETDSQTARRSRGSSDAHRCFDAAASGGAQQGFQLGKDLPDRVEIRAVGRR